MSQLAEFEGISRPSATGIVSRLHRLGLIKRVSPPEDARCAVVSLSPQGILVLEKARDERTAYLERRVETLSKDERAVLRAAIVILDRLAESE